MGVGARRIGFMALVVVGILLPLRKPAEGAPLTRDDRVARLRELTEEQRFARTRWIALAERDSALARSEKGLVGREPRIHLAGFAAGIRDEQAEAELARLWRAIGPMDSTVAVTLEVYNRARYASAAWWSDYWGNLISHDKGVTQCTAIMPAASRESGQLRIGTQLLDQAIAPCALLAAFGPPGTGVSAWLTATRYTLARSNSWLTRPADFLEGGSGPWGWVVDRSQTSSVEGRRLPKLFGIDGHAIATLLAPPYHYGAPGIRCIVGEPEACVESVLRSAYSTAEDPGVPVDLTVSPGLLRPAVVTLATPRAPAEFFLSDLIRSEGREKFRTFWKSPLGFEAAFQNAFGQSLGEWTSQWAKRQWLGSWEAHYRSRQIILGANLDRSWPLVALMWTVLALAAAGWVATRKQVVA